MLLCAALAATLAACPDQDDSTATADTLFFPDSGAAGPAADGRVPKAFSFPGEKTKCGGNDYLDANTIQLLRGGLLGPAGRAGFSAVWEPCYERIVFFGGQEIETPRCGTSLTPSYRNDTWVWIDGFANWLKLSPATSPPARAYHASAFDRSRKLVYVFGGRTASTDSGPYTLLADLWAFDVNKHTWAEVKTSGDVPSARAQARLFYDYANDRLVLIGGNAQADQADSGASAEVYTLALDTNTWTRQTIGGATPGARLGIGAVVDVNLEQKRIYVFGGRDGSGTLIGDLWQLDLTNLTWTELWKSGGAGAGPTPRSGAALGEDEKGKRLLLFGGRDATAPRNDLWWFDIASKTWTQNKTGDVRQSGSSCPDHCASTCQPDFFKLDELSPERRFDGRLIAADGLGYTLLTHGSTRCGFLNDTWQINPAAKPDASPGDPTATPPVPAEPQVWNVKITARQGLTCQRRNPTVTCDRLCSF